jgi:hypothetical protein
MGKLKNEPGIYDNEPGIYDVGEFVYLCLPAD